MIAGRNEWLTSVDLDDPTEHHTLPNVMGHMIRQICMDYSGIPDFRTLELDEILWFYEGIRNSLLMTTKPRNG